MGVVRKQGIYSGLYMYIGLILGTFSGIFLFPNIMGNDVYGFVNWLIYVTNTIMILSNLGLNTTAIKFMPYLREKGTGNKGFFRFLMSTVTLGSLAAAVVLFAFKDQVITLFKGNNLANTGFTVEYYFLLYFYIFIIGYKNVLTAYASALLKPRIGIFLIEVVERSIVILVILLFFYELINLETFFYLFSSKFLITVIGMVIFLIMIGEFNLSSRPTFMKEPMYKEMRSFSLYAILARSGSTIISKIDGLMISALLDFASLGIFMPFQLMAKVVKMPHMAMSKIAAPLVAAEWKNDNREKLSELYKRFANNNLAAGLLVFILIWSNIDAALIFLPEENAAAKAVVFYLGIGTIFFILVGFNGLILVNSPKYKFDLITRVFAAVTTVITNYFFIKEYGIVGAAMATALTMILPNSMNLGFVYHFFKLHPFTIKTLYILLLAVVVMLVGVYTPKIEINWLIDLVVRSILITILFLGPVFFFNLAPDIKEWTFKHLKKYKILR